MYYVVKIASWMEYVTIYSFDSKQDRRDFLQKQLDTYKALKIYKSHTDLDNDGFKMLFQEGNTVEYRLGLKR